MLLTFDHLLRNQHKDKSPEIMTMMKGYRLKMQYNSAKVNKRGLLEFIIHAEKKPHFFFSINKYFQVLET
jgi:hypothetical protein